MQRCCIVSFKIAHTFSIGLKFGEFTGQTNFSISLNLCYSFEWCIGAPSTIKTIPKNLLMKLSNSTSCTISTKSLAVRRPGGMKTKLDFWFLAKALQIMSEVLPFLNVGGKHLEWYVSNLVLQIYTWQIFFLISNVDSSVHTILSLCSIFQCWCALAKSSLYFWCFSLKNGFLRTTWIIMLWLWSVRCIVLSKNFVFQRFVEFASNITKKSVAGFLSDLY